MKYIITFLLLLSLPIIVKSQSIEALNDEIENLELREKSIQQQIDSLSGLVKDIRWELVKKRRALNEIEREQNKEELLGEGFTAKITSSLYSIKDEPTVTANSIGSVSVGDEVTVYDFFQNPYVKISHDGQEGYITYGALEESEMLDEVTGKTERLMEIDPRLPRLVKEFGEANARRIVDEKVWVGMTDEMARISWGRPRSVNRTTSAYGVREQWVYPNSKYLYFEDGVLTTIQD